MNATFGIPDTASALGMALLVALIILVLVVLALKNMVIFKMSMRNTMRRPSQTLLIISGLMLSTVLITTSLVMGNTVNYSLEVSQLPQVGNLDEGISKQTSVVHADIPYFSANEVQRMSAMLLANPQVDQVAGAIMTPQQSIPLFDETTQQVSAENAVLAGR